MPHDTLIIAELIILGIGTGLSAGLFGTGGGTVLIPFLLLIFHQLGYTPSTDMHIAIGTSLSIIVPTTLSSTLTHYKQKQLPIEMALKWLPAVIIGVLLGALLLHMIAAFVLKCFFSVYLLFCILYNLFKQDKNVHENAHLKLLVIVPIGLMIGCLSLMLGIGGGTLTVPILSFLQYPMLLALGLSSITSLCIASIGITIILCTSMGLSDLPAHTLGYMNWLVFLCVAPMTMIFSSLGVKLEKHISKQQLHHAYTAFLGVIFCVMLVHLYQLFT